MLVLVLGYALVDTYLNNILRFMSFEITYFLLKAFHFHKKSNQLPTKLQKQSDHRYKTNVFLK